MRTTGRQPLQSRRRPSAAMDEEDLLLQEEDLGGVLVKVNSADMAAELDSCPGKDMIRKQIHHISGKDELSTHGVLFQRSNRVIEPAICWGQPDLVGVVRNHSQRS